MIPFVWFDPILQPKPKGRVASYTASNKPLKHRTICTPIPAIQVNAPSSLNPLHPAAYRGGLYPHCTPEKPNARMYPGDQRTRAMTKPTKDSRITSATVEAAKRDADAGLEWEHPDPECKGLSLRVRGRGVSWNFRGPRLAGKNRRWTLGDHRVSPKEARRRAWAVRGRIQQGLDPTSLVTALVTGVDEQQQLDLRVEKKPSWEWSDAIGRFLADIVGTTRQATQDDYRGTLKNTPELQVFCGRQVCDIVREEIAEAVEKVRKRGVKTHHKKVLITCRRFFNWLGADARRRETSVPPNFLLGATAGAAERDVPGRRVVNKGIPAALPIGRALAIARAGVLGTLPSLGIQMVLGTVSRRRGVVGMRSQDYEPYTPGTYIWFQPPAFRKTADKIQSGAAHQVPLVGWGRGRHPGVPATA
jgi:hypothetical protein